MILTRKTDEQIEKMYDRINKDDLQHDTIDRDLMIDILDKMVLIADWYFDTYCTDFNKARRIYENNLLCYRIKNSATNKEPSTRSTVLSLLSGVWAFMDCLHSCPDRLFTDSIFMNTIGLCSVFQFVNKKVDAKYEYYYKLLNVPDGQPYTSKHYFFNDGTLTEKIHEFLSLDVEMLTASASISPHLLSAPLHQTAPDVLSHNFFSRHAAIWHMIDV